VRAHDCLEGILALLVCTSLATGLLALGCGTLAAFLGHEGQPGRGVEVDVVSEVVWEPARAGRNQVEVHVILRRL